MVDEPILDQFYAGEDVFIDKEELNLNPNQFLMLVSNQNEKKTALGRFTCYSEPIKLLNSNSKRNIWGLKPRNKEQIFAMDLLEDEKINVITLVGKAGCGKTLLAIAAGLSQVVEKDTYSRLVVSRPIQPMGRDIGYLPGSMEEKMSPWVAPIKDNLEFLMANDKSTLETYMKQGRIEVEGERSKVATIASKIL